MQRALGLPTPPTWPARTPAHMHTRVLPTPISPKRYTIPTHPYPHVHKQGLARGHRLALDIAPRAGHNEAAWAERLPRALRHLCAGWRQ